MAFICRFSDYFWDSVHAEPDLDLYKNLDSIHMQIFRLFLGQCVSKALTWNSIKSWIFRIFFGQCACRALTWNSIKSWIFRIFLGQYACRALTWTSTV